METQALTDLSSAALEQIAEVERLVREVQENIKAANGYAGRAPSPYHYWVDQPA